jgi:hypothetical protein
MKSTPSPKEISPHKKSVGYKPFTCPNFQLLGGTAFLPTPLELELELGLGREPVGIAGTLAVLCLGLPLPLIEGAP